MGKYMINPVELLIVAVCGLVLIMTTLFNGQPSETIIGIFGGYLGATYKNAASNKNTETTTTTTKKDYFKEGYETGKIPNGLENQKTQPTYSETRTEKKSIYDGQE